MEDQIKNVMSSVLGIESSEINENTTQNTIEQWDSLKHMNLIVAFEEEFNIEFTNEEIMEMVSYPLIKIIIEEKV